MALKNFTEDENHKTVQELDCSAEFVRGVESELIFLSALNIFFFVTAFLGNTLILVALHKETSLHPPSKLLYRNLAITDLCVGIIAEPLYGTYITSVVNERWDICHYANWAARFSGQTLCSVSLVTLTTISMDTQTSRLVAGAQIQTSCNFKKNVYNCDWFLDFVHCCCLSFFFLESFYKFIFSVHRYSSVPIHHNLRLHKNFLYSASQSSSC